MIIVDNLHRDLNMSALLPQTHKGKINSDPGKPGRETGSLLEVLQVQEGSHEGLLKHILCIFPIIYDAICPAQDHFGVAFAEFDKGNSVSRFRSREQYFFAHLVQTALDGKITG
jgi:hypothetical protein